MCIRDRHSTLRADACDKALSHLDKLRNANGDTPTAVIRDNMQRTMQNLSLIHI